MRFIVAAVLGVASVAFTGAAQADTAASTQPAPYVLSMPAGMVQVVVGEHTVICPPQYQEVVRKTLTELKPTTRPTTTSTSIAANVVSMHETLVGEMTADLGVSKESVESFYKDKLTPGLQFLAGFKPRSYILVCTQEQVTAAMKAGWHAPLFHFNPLADHTFFSPNISVPDNPDIKPDDLVIWSEVKDKDKDADIEEELTGIVHQFETSVYDGIMKGSLVKLRTVIGEFIEENVLKPLKMPSTEKWFGGGLVRAMCAKYMAQVTGTARATFAAEFEVDLSVNPLQAGSLDLMHEFDEAELKPVYVPYYLDAVSRRGTAVVEKLLDKAGDGCVVKILAAIKATPPGDNAALLALIQGATGVDLTQDLLPPAERSGK